MERVKITPESYARKIEFIETAMGEGAHLRLPRAKAAGRPLSEKAWNRTVDVGLLYHVGPNTTGSSISSIYGVSKEAIRQTKDKFIVELYKNSSKVTQKKYPLDSIALGKPVTLSQMEKVSRANGGITLKVKDLVEREGLTDTEGIISRLKITKGRLKVIAESEMFRLWGLNLPVESTHRSFKEIEDKVNQLTSDSELQKYLDGFSSGSIRGYINRKDSTHAVFGLLGATMKEMGLRYNRDVRPVALKLKANGLPLRIEPAGRPTIRGRKYQETYFVYFLKHRGRVIEAVKALGSLNKNPEIVSLRNAKSFLWNE